MTRCRIAKRPGANAISVRRDVLAKVEALKGTCSRPTSPSPSRATTARPRRRSPTNCSCTWASPCSACRCSSCLPRLARIASWSSLAIPSTLALTLLVFYLNGFTLNRITLFALIFSIGILVDDAIVVVENIVRHLRLPRTATARWTTIAIEAVDEVGNPTILATWAVIAAVLPMAFVGGLMGPYMRPIPIGATAAMLFSLVVAFIVTPWAAVRLLRESAASSRAAHADEQEDGRFTRLYRRVDGPADSRAPSGGGRSWPVIVGLLLGCRWRSSARLGEGEDAAVRQQERVPGHPQHARRHDAGAHRAGRARDGAPPSAREPEVTRLPDLRRHGRRPFNFNGLVRHYFLRRARTWPTSR